MKRIIRELNAAGVEYALTGALAVSYYGRPRTTADVDVILRTSPEEFPRLARVLRNAKLAADERRLRMAWGSKHRIAYFENKDGLRLDAILTSEVVPRRKAKILGLPSYVQEPGSLLLTKLRLMKVTMDEERRIVDREDVLSILKNVELDRAALLEESRRQLTHELLVELLADAEQQA